MSRITARQAIVAATVWVCLITGAVNHTSAPDAAPGCDIPRTGMFNPCAHLDTSQVQDRRQESGANGTGEDYTLDGPM